MSGAAPCCHSSRSCTCFHLSLERVLQALLYPALDAKMALTGAMEGVSMEGRSAEEGSSVCLRSRPCPSERDSQVRAVKAVLQSRLGPYEPVLTYLQSVLVWERPFQCVLLYIVVNVVFW